MTLRLLIVVLLSTCALSTTANDIYRTVDEQGRVIYSDRPGRGSGEKVNLPPVNTLPSETHRTAPATSQQRPQGSQHEYSLRIVSPHDETQVPPGQRDLAVAVSVSTPLHPDHLLLFLMNGEPLEETRNNSIMISEINRGSHQLTVEVIDAHGAVLATSDAVTVHVQRPSLLNPNRAQPSPGPRPRP